MSIYRNEMRFARVFIFVLLLSLLAACGKAPAESAPAAPAEPASAAPAEPAPPAAPATQEPTEEAPPEVPVSLPLLMSGEPPESVRTLEDADGSLRAEEKRALSGDAFLDNRYERPFAQTDMIYLPDVDIQTVDIASDDAFFYFTITLRGVDFGTGKFTAAYGIEFDRTLTGRGDLLVYATDPQPEWSSENLNVYADENGTVGGLRPMVAETGMASDGYETAVALENDRVAYARVNPQDATAVQIAVSRALLDNDEEFLWGAWADKVIKDPSKFDYNDTFGPSEAGSPIKPSADYPLKALHSLDNTCRLPFGFSQETSTTPGTCINVAPAAAGGGGCIRYCVRTCISLPGCCSWGCR